MVIEQIFVLNYITLETTLIVKVALEYSAFCTDELDTNKCTPNIPVLFFIFVKWSMFVWLLIAATTEGFPIILCLRTNANTC